MKVARTVLNGESGSNAADLHNTPLSFNLKMLSVIADAAYVKRVLDFLLEKWKNELPLLSDEGMDVEWYKIKNCLANFLDNAPYEMEFKSRFPDIAIKSVLPIGIEKWSKWDDDYAFGGEHVLNDYISGHMSKYLDPVKSSNLWYFAAEDLKKARLNSYKNAIYGYGGTHYENWKNLSHQNNNIKRMMISLSIWENCELENCILKEVEDIIDIITDIIMLLENPQAVIKSEFYNFDKAAADYFVRDYSYGSYRLKEGNSVKKEFDQWYMSYGKDLTLDLLKNKLIQEFTKLLDSGFLDTFLEDKNCNRIEIEKTYLTFCKYFFDEVGHKKESTCGRYIYTNQMYNENWLEKTYSFYRFLNMNFYLDCEISQLYPDYNMMSEEQYIFSEKQLSKREIKLAKAIKRLMNEYYYVNGKKKEPLVKLKRHWIPIFAVMSDKKLGAAPGDYSNFLRLIYRIAPPSGFRVELSASSLRRIVKTEYNQSFNMWKYNPDKHGDDEDRKRMTCIYMKFTEILQEYGL